VLFEAPDARVAVSPDDDAAPADDDAASADVASGPADVVIARLPVRTEGVHAIPLYEELPVVVVPADHEITAVDEIALDELEAMLGERMHAPAATPTGGPDAIALVAAGVGAVLLPKSLARLWARKDVDSRPVTGAPSTTVALVWRTDLPAERAALVEEFVGVVRGRTANTSRAAGSTEPPVKQKATAKAKARAAEARAAEAKAKASRKKTVAPGRTRPRRAR
jgi:DNA-binding transcriptional LysR family regulator